MLNKKIYLITLYTKRVFFLLIFLKKIKYINFFYIFKKNNRILVKIYPFYYKSSATNHFLKVVSKPSKSFFISLKALHLIKKRTDRFNLLLSTSKGLMTHSEAINRKVSGHIFGYFYI